MSPITDRSLLIAAAAGDETAFTELYLRYAGPLRVYFTNTLEASTGADDLVQQVFVQFLASKVFRSPKNGPDSLGKYLFTIAKNLVRNQVRSDSRRDKRERAYQSRREGFTPAKQSPDTHLEWAIAELPDHHRRPILLRFRHDMSVADIAELLNCAPGTIKSRLHYGLKRLQQLLTPREREHNPPTE